MQNKIATVFSNFKIENTSTVLGSISQANQQAIAGHQLRFDDNVKHPTVNLHSYRDMDIIAHGEHKTTVGKNMTTTVTQGNYLQQTEKDLHLYSDKGIHLINGQSRISITPTDITIESDEIGFNGPKLEAVPTSEINKKAAYNYYLVTYDGRKMLLTANIGQTLSEIVTDFNLSDFFETDRWEIKQKTMENIAKAKIKAEKKEYNKQQIREYNRLAWKGQYKPIQLAGTDTELPDKTNKIEAGKLGGILASENVLYGQAIKKELIECLLQLQPKIKKNNAGTRRGSS